MRTVRYLVKRPEVSAKIMHKSKITTAPIIQNTPYVLIYFLAMMMCKNTTKWCEWSVLTLCYENRARIELPYIYQTDKQNVSPLLEILSDTLFQPLAHTHTTITHRSHFQQRHSFRDSTLRDIRCSISAQSNTAINTHYHVDGIYSKYTTSVFLLNRN